MIRTKIGLLGLCAMVLGLMAFSATGAHAEGTWLILMKDGKVLNGNELPAALGLEAETAMVLHSEILGLKVLFLCKKIKAVNATIYGAGAIGEKSGVEKNSKLLFSECTVDMNGEPAPECTPTDPTDGKGFIVTKPLHVLAALHELAGGTRDDIVTLLPDEGKTYATLVTGSGCPIGNSVPIIGTIALKDCEGLALTHLIRHLVEQFSPLTKLFTISETAEHAATLLGSAWAFLEGEHLGLAWSISNL